ncbi:16S rRNA (cytosine(967)-C(5))-methyltransferase RsmB [Vagococcus intermedius]|uniref:16S rRNA (cytosine(967)-C(5))-methyltransferase n=1 Tax=Vagococcus intermedius TaxID=2991418 RepID=A0AAF0I969_9ENTE|nr:16S rRNA (cytosine(967)-C(5))-methyltransferase RsmB [Vagococcus intermedius]WEG73172.1 16S rRNA (cytosine(967)-C(5))-methyltransferase RsmB [Vagococcus intermedius]WEG75256.1 16S rRNA (cytosine(967)-C(5))-methyltransferase RsmB [Vagococcus intermedius]
MAKRIPVKIKRSPRFVAMNLLTKVETQQAYSNLVINQAMNEAQLSEKDGRLLTEIVYGTISRKLTLEFYLAPFIEKAKKVDPWVRQLLLLSLYQLEYLDRVPAHAIVDEAVEIAKVRGNIGASKFVNGVLRTIQREGVPSLETVTDSIERLSIEISMPRWLTEKFIADIGLEETRALGLSLFEPSRVSARVNTALVSREEAIESVSDDGIEVEESKLSPVGITGKKGFLAGSWLFKEGKLTIQDETSMLVAPSLQIEPSHQVLDACAAPGGKSTHMATYIDETLGGKITALDIHKHKVKLINDNAERLHVAERIDAMILDARKVDETFADNSFDRILADVPCSGLGLLRRKPDIKYSKKASDFANLPSIQLGILESLVPKLKVGGIMTYSTCTVSKEENQAVVQTFLEKYPEFEAIDVMGCDDLQATDGLPSVTIYPHHYQTDGFFICCLRRKA